jgi:hypothetical protein
VLEVLIYEPASFTIIAIADAAAMARSTVTETINRLAAAEPVPASSGVAGATACRGRPPMRLRGGDRRSRRISGLLWRQYSRPGKARVMKQEEKSLPQAA